MHKLTLVLLLTFTSFFGLSQNTITGKIVDELGLPIYMASVEIDQTDDIVYTNYEGDFTLNSKKDFHWKINIKSKGYKSESFFVLDKGKTEALVLEYNSEMKKLLEKKIGFYHKSYWKRTYNLDLFPKSKKQFVLVLSK